MSAAAGADASRRAVLTSLLESPVLCGWIVGAGAIHVALAATPLGGWPCPFRAATGWPCPGCGLGRACVVLLGGEVREAMRLHVFAGLLLVALPALIAGAVPWAGRARVRALVRGLEERTWVVPMLLVGLLVYWLARLALDADGWRALVV